MQERQLAFEAIGTRWTIQVQNSSSTDDWQALSAAITERIAVFDKTYSRFRDDSLITKMAGRAGTYDMPDDGYPLLAFYEQLYQVTGGRVTPLIGQTMADAGYDARYSFRPGPLHAPPALNDVLQYDEEHITLSQPALLDFGAAGKGYLVDIIHELLIQADSEQHLINAGGDIRHFSASDESVEIGLENPRSTDEAIGIVSIQNQALCASSGSRRAWDKYTHIINPDTLESPQDIIATWVVADTAMQADGLATALFFAEPSALRDRFDFSYALLDQTMQLTRSKDFPITELYEVPAA